jgi:hypothetical protein
MRRFFVVLICVFAVSCDFANPDGRKQPAVNGTGEGGLWLNFTIDGEAVGGEAGADSARTVLTDPASFTVSDYEVTVKRKDNDAVIIGPDTYSAAGGIQLNLNIEVKTPVIIEVRALNSAAAELARGSREFSESDFGTSTSYEIPLYKNSDGKAKLNLKLEFPNNQNISQITWTLKDYATGTLKLTQLIGATYFSTPSAGKYGTVISADDIVPAGQERATYLLTIDFQRAGGASAGFFLESVVAVRGWTADKWLLPDGTLALKREFTEEEFRASSSTLDISLTNNSSENALFNSGSEALYIDVNKVLDNPSTSWYTSSFTLEITTAGSGDFGTYDWELFSNEITTSGSMSQTDKVSGSSPPKYVKTLNSIGLTENWQLKITSYAADRQTQKVYYIRPASAKRGGAYYASLAGAVAAASGSAGSPHEITLLRDLAMASGGNLTLNSGKYIKLVSPSGTARSLKRASGNTANPLITVNGGQLTLENIIIDGGAVWMGGTASPSSPAFGAANTGPGAVTASNTLILATGSGAKITLGAGAVLRNNDNNSNNNTTTGGALNARYGAAVVINGGEVSRNQTYRLGGGIMLLGTAAQRTTLTLITGSINNNRVTQYDGGGIACEGANIEMRGGFVSSNRARYGGGIHAWRGADTSPNTLTISGGEISGNAATQGDASGGGGGIQATDGLRFVMSGGLITGNTAPLGGGVYVFAAYDSFTMSGGARIAPNNDVYLQTNTAITIGGTLTATPPNFTAVITPSSYSTTQVLIGTLSGNNERFGVTPQSVSISWKVNTYGYIESTATMPDVWWLGADTEDAANGKIAGNSGVFAIPLGKTADVFLVGGGGSGASCNGGNLMGGGKGGQTVSQTSLGPGAYAWLIGPGAAHPWWSPNGTSGYAGGETNFGPVSAAGGAGGIAGISTLSPGASGQSCSISLPSGWSYGGITLSGALYGAGGGDGKAASPSGDYKSGGSTGGGGTAASGGTGTTNQNGSFYGAGGGGRALAHDSGDGFKGVIFVEIN